jgi:VanZ family protein
MKKNIIRIILILLLAITFIVIFNFSNEDSIKSGNTSKKITNEITKNIDSIQKLDKVEKTKELDRIESIIRKIAHFSLYTLVGILLMAICSTYNLNEIIRIIISLLSGIVYAISDEIHQMFIAGRTAKPTDVFIDTLGVILGIVITMLILKIVSNRNKSKISKI